MIGKNWDLRDRPRIQLFDNDGDIRCREYRQCRAGPGNLAQLQKVRTGKFTTPILQHPVKTRSMPNPFC